MPDRPHRPHGSPHAEWPGLPDPNAPLAPVAPAPEEPAAAPPDPAPRRKRRSKADTLDAITELGSNQVAQPKSSIQMLSIIGQIEGHLALPAQNKTTKYEHLIPQLVAVEQNDEIEGLLIILNTVGGDVEAGLALAEMIASLSKPTVSLVLGGGHSIGVPIAVSATYSYIASTATMTIHPIRLTGLVIGVPQTYEYLDKMQDRVVKFVVNNSHITEQKFRELMFRTGELARDIGTVLVGKDAVACGLIDEVGGIADAVRKVQQLVQDRRSGKSVLRHDRPAPVQLFSPGAYTPPQPPNPMPFTEPFFPPGSVPT